MQFFKYLSVTVLSSVLFMQCSSTKQLQKEASFKTDQVYYQSWVAGVKGGGSGINVFIPITSELKTLKLDSLYFRQYKMALQTQPNNPNLYIGRILTKANQQEGFKEETTKIPFDLQPNEAVVSYIENNDIKYYKIENIIEKPAEQYPSAPPKN
ncbi:hypothetical protein [Olleya aquimaris]|uniref:Uncharacterized protein n=1 Tax=Olleya aquimaris TaxID=639310 RepID=A0A327RLF3_9FLAO|nr:hypothetical protein [Olleya aquimaris]RAJ17936.1 hypothetical protein LY08_00206 [Olleya aquimaris]